MDEKNAFIANYDSGHVPWASAAESRDSAQPPDSKVAYGWSAGEQPPHSVFNWWQNRVDSRLDKLEANIAYLVHQIDQLTTLAEKELDMA